MSICLTNVFRRRAFLLARGRKLNVDWRSTPVSRVLLPSLITAKNILCSILIRSGTAVTTTWRGVRLLRVGRANRILPRRPGGYGTGTPRRACLRA